VVALVERVRDGLAEAVEGRCCATRFSRTTRPVRSSRSVGW
jgi:hypothetical protein